MNIFGEMVEGNNVDSQTRCAHYHKEIDIIAIKFKCCGEWFPCFECHSENTDHEPQVWSKNELDEKAILCGNCGYQLAIEEYLNCDSICPKCESSFNPGCANHYHLYFEC
ncbi:MAG: CHY zinc finger protein [Pyrinomonadaceae bacterium]